MVIRKSIPFKIRLILQADLGSRTINIESTDGQVELEGKQSKQIEINTEYLGQDEIRLCGFSGFVADPEPNIIIERLEINDYQVRDYNSILSFRMSGNKFVENKLVDGLDRIDFNGDLVIQMNSKNKDRLMWFPTTFSYNKDDMVYLNSILNCQSSFGCYGMEQDCIHEPPYKLFDPRALSDNKNYDIIALGCSFTFGTGIKKNMSWPSLLQGQGHHILNLGVPGAGIDTIFVNLKNLLKKRFSFKKILILLPDVGTRKLYTIKKHDLYFHLITSGATPTQFSEGDFNIFFQKDELDKIYRDRHRDMVLSGSTERDTRIIKRLVRVLNDHRIDYAVGSWSEATYEVLEKNIEEDKLLPMFNKDLDTRTGQDGKHPAEQIHEKWVKSIEHLI